MRSGLALSLILIAGSPGPGVWPFNHKKPDDKPSPVTTQTAAPTDPVAAIQSNPSYIIGPEDTLHISVWREPDLSGTLPVRGDGKISLPLLNDVPAAGQTPMQLAALLTERLKKYVDDPRVTVVVSQMNSQKFFVTGEVQHTGALPLTPNMTVLQALSTAGLTQFANTKKIYVLRRSNGVEQKLAVNYKKLVKGKDQEMDQNILLKPGDTIVVP